MNGHCDPQVIEEKEENQSNEAEMQENKSTFRKHMYLS